MSTKEKINSKTDIKSFEARLKQLEKNYHEKNSEITKLTFQSASNQSEINLLLKEFEDDNTLQTIDQLFSEKSNIKSKRSEHSCVSEELIHYDINNHNNTGFKIKNNTNIKTSSMPKINKNKINEGFKINSSINNNPSISLGSNKSIENINKNKKQSINKNSNKSNINNYIYNINIINSNNGEQSINRNQRNISKKRSASNSQDSNIKNTSYKEKENEIQLKQKDNYPSKSSSIKENTNIESNKKDNTKKSNLKSFSQYESPNEYENNVKTNSNKNRKIEIKEDSVDQKTNNERILKKNKETLKEMFDLESFGNNDSKSKNKNKKGNEICEDEEVKDILNNKIANNPKSDFKNIGKDINSNKAIIKDNTNIVDKKDTSKIIATKNEKFVNNKKSDTSLSNTQNLVSGKQYNENKNDNYSKTISNSKLNNDAELNLNPTHSQTINQNQNQNNKNNGKLGIGFGSKITNFNNSKKNNMFSENKIEINKVTNIKKIKTLKNNSEMVDKQSNGFQSQTFRSKNSTTNDQMSSVKKNNTIETKGNVDKRNSAFKNKVKSKASENIKKLDNSFKEINPKNNIDLIFREVNTRSNSVINIPDNKNYDVENLKKNSTFYNKDSFSKQNYLNELDQLVSSSAKVEVQSKNSNSKLIGLDKPDDMIRIHRANTNIYNSSLLNEIKTNYKHLKNVMKSDTKANKISVILSNNNVVPLKLRSILILNSKKAYRYTDLSSFFEEIVSNTNKRLLSIKDQLSTYKMNIDVINQVEKGYVPCKTIQAFLNLITKEDEQDFKDESQLNSPNDLLSEIIIALITKNEKKFQNNVEKASVPINMSLNMTNNNTANNKLMIIPKNNLDLLNSPQYKGKKTYTQALYKLMSQMKIFKLKDLLFEKLNGDIFINKQIHNLLIEYIENNPDIFDMSLETLRGLNKVSKILVYFIHDLMKFIERKCSDGTYLYNLRLLMLEESYFKIKMKKLKKYYSQF